MTTTPEFALLSLYVYEVKNKVDNRTNLPTGWELAEPLHSDGLDGFSYGVFRRIGTTEIVLAYAGTNEAVDWAANIANGFGLSSTQTTQAATAYLQAKQQYGSDITLTGHSLGGGLASVMAVWFDRPATVFDEAPFELTARNPAFTAITKAALWLAGYSDPAFTAYIGLLDFYAREAQVTNYYTSEEALQIGRMLWPTVLGTDTLVIHSVGTRQCIHYRINSKKRPTEKGCQRKVCKPDSQSEVDVACSKRLHRCVVANTNTQAFQR